MLQENHSSWDSYACYGSADEVHGATVHHDDICRLSLAQLPYNNPSTGAKTRLQDRGTQLVSVAR